MIHTDIPTNLDALGSIYVFKLLTNGHVLIPRDYRCNQKGTWTHNDHL